MNQNRILGIDPGSRFAGLGLIEMDGERLKLLHVGVLDLNTKLELPLRLAELSLRLKNFFEEYRPHHVVIEKIFLGKNVESAFVLGHARGVCLATSATYGAAIHEVSPKTVKKQVTGHGGASKEEVSLFMRQIFKMPDLKLALDATDALAMAVSFAYNSNTRMVHNRLMENT